MPSGLPPDLIQAFQDTWFATLGERLSVDRAEQAAESMLDLASLLGAIAADTQLSTDQV